MPCDAMPPPPLRAKVEVKVEVKAEAKAEGMAESAYSSRGDVDAGADEAAPVYRSLSASALAPQPPPAAEVEMATAVEPTAEAASEASERFERGEKRKRQCRARAAADEVARDSAVVATEPESCSMRAPALTA